jgi:hypothetical protein
MWTRCHCATEIEHVLYFMGMLLVNMDEFIENGFAWVGNAIMLTTCFYLHLCVFQCTSAARSCVHLLVFGNYSARIITPEEALGRQAFSKVRALPSPIGLTPSCRRAGPHFWESPPPRASSYMYGPTHTIVHKCCSTPPIPIFDIPVDQEVHEYKLLLVVHSSIQAIPYQKQQRTYSYDQKLVTHTFKG